MMVDKVLISIIMPVYNGSGVISKAIDSILGQTFKQWELIVIDDCSIDNTKEILQSYMEKDSRIHFYKQTKNMGPGAAKNAALKLAKGSYITFCDADDWVENNMYEEMYRAADSNNADVVLCGYFQDVYGQNESKKKTLEIKADSGFTVSGSNVAASVPKLDQQKVFSYAWNKLYSREIIVQNNVEFSQKLFGEDYDFNIAFFNYVNIMSVLKNSYYHYIKKDSESLTAKYIASYYEIIEDRFSRMRTYLVSKRVYCDVCKETALTVHIKHVLTAMIRDCDKRAGYTKKERYKRIKLMLGNSYSIEAQKYASSETRSGRICNSVFKTHNSAVLFIFTGLAWFVQNKMSFLFECLK